MRTTFGNLSQSIFRKDGKKTRKIESSCTKTKFLIDTLTQEDLINALREPTVVIKTNLTKFQFLAGLAHQVDLARNETNYLAFK